MNPDIITPVIIAIIAALPGIFALNSQRRKTDADAAQAVSGAAVALAKQTQDSINDFQARIDVMDFRLNEQSSVIQLQEKQIESLRTDVAILREKIREFRQGIAILTAQIEGAGMTPQYRPKDEQL